MKMRVTVDKIKATECVYEVEAESIEEAKDMIRCGEVEPKVGDSSMDYDYFGNFCVEVL